MFFFFIDTCSFLFHTFSSPKWLQLSEKDDEIEALKKKLKRLQDSSEGVVLSHTYAHSETSSKSSKAGSSKRTSGGSISNGGGYDSLSRELKELEADMANHGGGTESSSSRSRSGSMKNPRSHSSKPSRSSSGSESKDESGSSTRGEEHGAEYRRLELLSEKQRSVIARLKEQCNVLELNLKTATAASNQFSLSGGHRVAPPKRIGLEQQRARRPSKATRGSIFSDSGSPLVPLGAKAQVREENRKIVTLLKQVDERDETIRGLRDEIAGLKKKGRSKHKMDSLNVKNMKEPKSFDEYVEQTTELKTEISKLKKQINWWRKRWTDRLQAEKKAGPFRDTASAHDGDDFNSVDGDSQGCTAIDERDAGEGDGDDASRGMTASVAALSHGYFDLTGGPLGNNRSFGSPLSTLVEEGGNPFGVARIANLSAPPSPMNGSVSPPSSRRSLRSHGRIRKGSVFGNQGDIVSAITASSSVVASLMASGSRDEGASTTHAVEQQHVTETARQSVGSSFPFSVSAIRGNKQIQPRQTAAASREQVPKLTLGLHRGTTHRSKLELGRTIQSARPLQRLTSTVNRPVAPSSPVRRQKHLRTRSVGGRLTALSFPMLQVSSIHSAR